MEKVYDTYNDLHVNSVVIFASSEQYVVLDENDENSIGYILFEDDNFSKKLSVEKAHQLFLNNLVLVTISMSSKEIWYRPAIMAIGTTMSGDDCIMLVHDGQDQVTFVAFDGEWNSQDSDSESSVETS